jgi:hypothetical protein
VRCPDVGDLIFDLVFAPVTDAEVVENRVHPDVAPEPGESRQDAIDALVARGARPADVGSGTCRGWSCRTRSAPGSVS